MLRLNNYYVSFYMQVEENINIFDTTMKWFLSKKHCINFLKERYKKIAIINIIEL